MKNEIRIKHTKFLGLDTPTVETEIAGILVEGGFDMSKPILRYTDFQTTEEVFQQRKELEIKSSDDVLNLTDMFKKQAELDSMLLDKFNMTHGQAIPFIVRALKSEFGEAQAKWGGFKYWSTTPKYGRDEIIEELADMLHFYLSIGNYLNVPLEHTYTDWTQNSLGQMDAMDYSLSRVDEPLGWYMSFAVFRGLVHDWGFDWENDLIRMYKAKNKINHERQQNGY